MSYEIPYVDYDYDIDYEQARMLGEVYADNREEFDGMISESGIKFGFTDQELSQNLHNYLGWDEDEEFEGDVTKYFVKKALQRLIDYKKENGNVEYEWNIYDEIHRGFIAGMYKATDEEVEQAEIMWNDTESDDCIGYYEEAFDRIRGNW